STPADPSAARRLRLLIAAVVGAGSLVVLSALPGVVGHQAPAAWRIALASAAFMLGDIAVLHLRFGHNQHSFTWSETAVVLGLVLLPSPWTRVIAPVAVGVAHLLARRPLVKVAF